MQRKSSDLRWPRVMREITVGDGGHEALTGEPSGWVLSHEIAFRMPTPYRLRKATRGSALSRAELRSGVVEDPSMSGRFLHGNREVSRLTVGYAGGPHREAARHSR
jgi:hypothetical protein